MKIKKNIKQDEDKKWYITKWLVKKVINYHIIIKIIIIIIIITYNGIVYVINSLMSCIYD